MKIIPLRIAEKIFNDGRIEDAEDWEEMKLEVEHEMNTLEISIPELREEVLKTIHNYLY